MAGWYDDESGSDRLEDGGRSANSGNSGSGWLDLPDAMDWGFPTTPEKPKREKSMSELLYPGYDKPEPEAQPKVLDWGTPRAGKSAAERMYPGLFQNQEQDGGESRLPASHRPSTWLESAAAVLYPGYDKPEPEPQSKAPAWGAPKREKSMAELLYPRHFPQDDQEQGWPAPDVLYPSHRKTPGVPDGAVLNASGQGADVVTGSGDDALDEVPADSGGGFWDRLGAWLEPGEAEAKGRQPANNNPYPVNASKEQQVDHLTRVLVKETGGMRDDPLDRESFEDLQNARKHMAVVAMRNRDVGLFKGDWPAQDKKVWDDCRAAAEAGWEAAQGVPKDVQNFYMVQRGKETRQPPRWGNDDSLYYEFGPFRSYGGAIADGENAYIRIHGKKQR